MVAPRLVLLVVLAVALDVHADQGSGTRPADQAGEARATKTGLIPARFVDGLEEAAASIPFPDYTKDIALFINCAARLDPTPARQS